ncbi:MAG: DUF58 domain-containing protein [Actinobacteria bacterium]|nr:DUF58 domain-containing protein [Actinomycetota bacterium]
MLEPGLLLALFFLAWANISYSYIILFLLKFKINEWATEGKAYEKTNMVQIPLLVLMIGLFIVTMLTTSNPVCAFGFVAAINSFAVLVRTCIVYERATGVSLITGKVVDDELAQGVQAGAKGGGVPVEPLLPQATPPRKPPAPKPRAGKKRNSRWTVRAALALAVAVALGLLAYLTSNALVYLPALAALILTAMDYAFCLLSTGDMDRIMVSREAPAYAEEDDLVEVKLEVYNPAGRINHLTIVDNFAAESAPYRKRKIAVGSLAAEEKTTLSYGAVCYRRGVFDIGPLEVRREFPLGLFKNRRIIDERCFIKIYPHLYPNRGFHLVAGGTRERVGLNTIDKSGLSNDFFGVREYRPGDSRRLIHWKSTARHQILMVKELEMPADLDLTAVIDLDSAAWSGDDKYNTFEYAVKIVGAVSEEVLAKGYDLRIVALGNGPRQLEIKGGRREFPRVLDFLAGLKQTGSRHIFETLLTLPKQGGNGSTLLLPLQVPFPGILETLLFLRRRKMETIVLLFDRSSFDFRSPYRTAERQVFKSTYALLKRNGFTVYPVNYLGGPMIYELQRDEAL